MSQLSYVQGREHSRPQWSAVRSARLGAVAFFGGIAGINLFACLFGEFEWVFLHLLAALSAMYLLAECVVYLRNSDAFGLLSPAFLATFIHFGFSYLGAPTALVFDPDTVTRWTPYLNEAPEDLSWTMVVAMAAAFTMWRAYYFVNREVGPLRESVAHSRFVRTELQPRVSLALLVQCGYFVLVAYSIRIGVFGFAGTSAALIEHASILYLLYIGMSAGAFALFLLLLQYYRELSSGRRRPDLGLLCIALVVVHVGVGALSGFKSAMVTPFLMAGLARFVVLRKVSIVYVALAVTALVAAYQIIEPYRQYLSNQNVSRDIGSLWGALADAANSQRASRDTGQSTSAQIVDRLDLLVMTSIGIQYVDRGKLSAEDKWMFEESILLSPVLAFIPRAAWTDKPIRQFGLWFSRQVLGFHDERTAVGMGPVAFLYMAGGMIGVILGFALFGALQAIFFEGIGRASAGGFIIYLAIASSLVTIPTTVGPVLTGLLRILPLVIALQFIVLKPTVKSIPTRQGAKRPL